MELEQINIIIKKAEIGEENDIYNILIGAFGNRYIRFTIFQSEKSVNHLRQMIINQGKENNFIFTAKRMEILGFYYAVQRKDELFLNYIAVHSKFRRQGIGQMLLDHYEKLAKFLNLNKCALNVFESNKKVLEWYISNGYEIQKRTYLARINLEKIKIKKLFNGILIDKNAYLEAEKLEKEQGFSKFDLYYKKNHIQLGIIGGDTFKILKDGGFSFEEVAYIILNSWLPKRRWLLITSEKEINFLDCIESKENILFMSKSININK